MSSRPVLREQEGNSDKLCFVESARSRPNTIDFNIEIHPTVLRMSFFDPPEMNGDRFSRSSKGTDHSERGSLLAPPGSHKVYVYEDELPTENCLSFKTHMPGGRSASAEHVLSCQKVSKPLQADTRKCNQFLGVDLRSQSHFGLLQRVQSTTGVPDTYRVAGL